MGGLGWETNECGKEKSKVWNEYGVGTIRVMGKG